MAGVFFGLAKTAQAQTVVEPRPFEAALSANCALKGEVPPERFEFEVQLEGNETTSKFRLTQIFCDRAAYNTSEIWVLKDEYDEEQVLSFAVPETMVSYAEGSEQKTVEDIAITSYTSTVQLSNSSFDPATVTISSFHKWRGVGDAASGGVWEFRKGRFALKSYEIDASYDGAINAQTIIDFERPTP